MTTREIRTTKEYGIMSIITFEGFWDIIKEFRKIIDKFEKGE